MSKTECEKIIIRCGDFPNVPLMGIRGDINYNPTLAVRQLGYALVGPPDASFVWETLYYDVPDVTGVMAKAVQAWKSIRLEGGQYFGKKDPTAYASYIHWIKDKNSDRQWPSITGAAAFYPSEHIPNAISKGNYERVLDQNRLLLEEKETLAVNCLVATQTKN